MADAFGSPTIFIEEPQSGGLAVGNHHCTGTAQNMPQGTDLRVSYLNYGMGMYNSGWRAVDEDFPVWGTSETIPIQKAQQGPSYWQMVAFPVDNPGINDAEGGNVE